MLIQKNSVRFKLRAFRAESKPLRPEKICEICNFLDGFHATLILNFNQKNLRGKPDLPPEIQEDGIVIQRMTIEAGAEARVNTAAARRILLH